MDVYKLRTSDWAEKPLERARFEEETKMQPPWYVNNDKMGKSCFAVCPGCDNPIQIIGFYQKARHTDKPYAQHVPRSVSRLATYRQEAFNFCPYAAPRRYDPEGRRSETDPLGDKILDLLVQHFDRVVFILEEDTGIKITTGLAEDMLHHYRSRAGHLYMGATLQNVPWVFAYMTLSNSLMGRRIPGDDALLEAIEKKVPGAVINWERKQVTWKAKGTFVELNYCFIHHRTRHSDDTLKESMSMVVSHGRDNTTVYRKNITFDRVRFKRLINTPEERARRPRQKELVALAESILGRRKTVGITR
ncbi:hypothetical protein [Billgrantia desiderata]|uniref:hypothetical protein n=1 Tax=Billgrantia desiderata TaxID=52021 RepID=UPI001F3E30F2|nr:hypothetical protein [Halomonas desiderata]MCE8014348.1 hypothetical protein [Halomonas desiderata]